MPDDSEKSRLPGWIGWTPRGEPDPRTLMPHFDTSDFYKKLSAPPNSLRALTICCWTDLLGFGKALADAGWHPSADVWKALHERLRDAHLCCFQSLDLAGETVLALNDGIVRCYSSEYMSNLTLVSMWLRACVFTHNWINDRESYMGLPGARTVLSCGEELSFSHPEFRLRDFILESTKRISHPNQGYEDFVSRQIVIHPTQLQLNLAFSRAYLLEQAGSKHRIKGPHFYIDQTVLEAFSAEAERMKVAVLDTQIDAGRLFAIPQAEREGYYHLGLLLESPPIPVATSRISTTVWRVLGYCPWDELQPFGFAVN